MLRDVRFGLRTMLKSPGFTAVAVFTLALGIGATTAVFTIIKAVILQPLPYPQPNQLVEIRSLQQTKSADLVPNAVSFPDFFDWRAQNHSFESMACYAPKTFTITGSHQAEQILGAVVSADLFSMLKVQPAMGRGFHREEEAPGSRVAVVSNEFWKSTLDADPGAVGKPVQLDGQNYTVVGVMPAGFRFPATSRSSVIWTTFAELTESHSQQPPLTEQRGASVLRVIGRVKANMSLASAKADLDLIARNLARQYAGTNAGRPATQLTDERESLTGNVRPALLVLLAAVGGVLLIACVNIANLLLARASGRTKEISIRAALGARREQIILQLLTESMLLSIIGSGAGLFLAWMGLHFFLKFAPRNIPRLDTAQVDLNVAMFTVILAIITGCLFGLMPALQTAKAHAGETQKDLKGSVGITRGQNRLRNALVVIETGMGLVLLVSAGLLLISFFRLSNVDLGFSPRHILTFRIGLSRAKFDPDRQARLYEDLLTQIRTLPGVTSAAGVMVPPLSGSSMSATFQEEGHPLVASARPQADLNVVTPDYFATMGIPFISGRDFNKRDDSQSPPVVIVNQSFVRRFFPTENPLDKRIGPDFSRQAVNPMRQIVGVVSDMKDHGFNEESRPAYYIALAQEPNAITFCVKTAGDPSNLILAIRNRVSTVNADVPVYGLQMLDEAASSSLAQPRFYAFLLGLFACLALILTAVGLYGVMAYLVEQRTREIGLRIALGATQGNVMRMVLKKGIVLTAVGVCIGVVGALAATRFISSLLFDVKPLDPMTYALVVAVLFAVSLLASYVPAYRATRIDPMTTLRDQ